MKKIPVKTKGMYYCVNKNTNKPSKLNRMWNVLTDQDVLNGDVYHAIYFGKVLNGSKEERFYVGIDLACLSEDLSSFAKQYRSNDYKYDGRENDRCCYDFKFDNDALSFQNKKWKCSGKINDTILEVYFKNKSTGHSFHMRFNYFDAAY